MTLFPLIPFSVPVPPVSSALLHLSSPPFLFWKSPSPLGLDESSSEMRPPSIAPFPVSSACLRCSFSLGVVFFLITAAISFPLLYFLVFSLISLLSPPGLDFRCPSLCLDFRTFDPLTIDPHYPNFLALIPLLRFFFPNSVGFSLEVLAIRKCPSFPPNLLRAGRAFISCVSEMSPLHPLSLVRHRSFLFWIVCFFSLSIRNFPYFPAESLFLVSCPPLSYSGNLVKTPSPTSLSLPGF